MLDGAGYTVKDLSINRSDEVYVGLFGGLTETAAVMNLNLTGNILGKNNVGGIAARNFGMIRNVVNKANVSGESSVGGITNMNYGRLAFVSNSGDVTGTGQSSGAPGASVGGIAAYNGESVSKTGTIDSAENTGKITGGGQIGGIPGSNGAEVRSRMSATEAPSQVMLLKDKTLEESTAQMPALSKMLIIMAM